MLLCIVNMTLNPMQSAPTHTAISIGASTMAKAWKTKSVTRSTSTVKSVCHSANSVLGLP